ncbi:MAG: MOSC domain-containing protein [Actinobacteria bacterium]|nr:MOSC domain-containing protein [Actinomycetota bacterium]
MGKIDALCISKKKGQRKHPVDSAIFRADYGIEGDAHAGPWHRQVTLLSAGDIETVRAGGLPEVGPGDFAENVVVSGVDLNSLGLGSRLRLGPDVVLSVTQIGKVCHTPCRIAKLTGDCIMPRWGLFARVQKGGQVKVGDEIEILETVRRDVFQAVVLTISDRCSQGTRPDTAGPAVVKRLKEKLQVHIYRTEIWPDDKSTIIDRLKHYSNGHSIDLVVTVGGTGFAPRDVTPEATREVLERLTPGLDEAMRAGSLSKTPHAMLSRGTSGMRASTLIVNLPGSERAALENLDVILPALNHGLLKLRGDSADCAPPPGP